MRKRWMLAVLVVCVLGGTALSMGLFDRVEGEDQGTFSGVKVIELGNFVRVDVEAEKDGTWSYKGYNVRTGSVFNVPYDLYVVKTAAGEFRITDKGTGNGKVQVNGKLHTVPAGQHLVIGKDGKITTAAGDSSQLPEPIPEK